MSESGGGDKCYAKSGGDRGGYGSSPYGGTGWLRGSAGLAIGFVKMEKVGATSSGGGDRNTEGSLDFWLYLMALLGAMFAVGYLCCTVKHMKSNKVMTSTGSQTEEAPAARPAASARIATTTVCRSLRQDTIHLSEACGHLRSCTVIQMPVCRDCLKQQ